MEIIFQTTGGDEYSLNGENDIPNKKMDNIRGSLILK